MRASFDFALESHSIVKRKLVEDPWHTPVEFFAKLATDLVTVSSDDRLRPPSEEVDPTPLSEEAIQAVHACPIASVA